MADLEATLYDLYGVETSEEKVMAPVDEAWRSGMIRDAEAIGYPLMHEERSNFFRLPADFLIGRCSHLADVPTPAPDYGGEEGSGTRAA